MSLRVSIREQYRTLEQKIKFFRHHGYRLDLDNPRSFNEKIIWRKVFDRNPLLPSIVDKIAARDYVIEKLGKETGGQILVPLLFVAENPEDIPFSNLPEEYIVKPNHGSGWSVIVDKEHRVPHERIVSQCRKWLRKTYGRSKMEWAYSRITRCIIVEKLLKNSQGRLVSDFKFHVFGGRVEWVFVMHDRFGPRSSARYLRDFSRMGNDSQAYQAARNIDRPENFEQMVEIAEKLAEDFDYIRVDLYNVEGAIFFGELTIYPGSGFNQMGMEMDFRMGEKWELDRRFARDFRPWF
jgi:hypothetical protein